MGAPGWEWESGRREKKWKRNEMRRWGSLPGVVLGKEQKGKKWGRDGESTTLGMEGEKN